MPSPPNSPASPSISPIPSDTRDRILQAAAEIYEAGGRDRFPTVDQVRRTVRADMHAVTTVMREWRRAQHAQHAPTVVQVPDAIASTHSQALATLWLQAQELANEGLRAAQAGWEAERAELEALRTEIVQAFEAQGADLAEANRRTQQAETTAHSVGQALEAQGVELKEMHVRTAALEADMRKARQQATADLAEAARREQQARNNLMAAASALDEYRKAAEAREKAAEAGRAQLQKETMQAREKAAELSGRLQALQEQNAALLARLGPDEPPARKGR